jgi:hypothetical protein
MLTNTMQNEDGGWGTSIRGSSSMFGTCLNYIALRLLGDEPNDKNSALAKGRVWILSHGDATSMPLLQGPKKFKHCQLISLTSF